MPTTAKGVHYPAAADPDDVPADLQAIADWIDARPGVSAVTTTQRNALTGVDLWNGRVIFNTTTQQIEQFRLATPAWVPASLADAIAASLVDAKGDLLVGSAADTVIRKAVGADGTLLMADSTAAGGVKWGGLPFIGCMAYLAGANQTFTTAVEAPLLWDAESFDTSAFHSTASNKERFTIPAGLDGYYEITAVIRWSHNATGRRNVSIKQNGTTYLAEHNVGGGSGDTTGGLIQHISVVAYLAAGDYVSVTGIQASGGNLDVPAATAPSYAILKRLGS